MPAAGSGCWSRRTRCCGAPQRICRRLRYREKALPLVKGLAAEGIPVVVTCRVLKLAREPYYRWLAEPVTAGEETEACGSARPTDGGANSASHGAARTAAPWGCRAGAGIGGRRSGGSCWRSQYSPSTASSQRGPIPRSRVPSRSVQKSHRSQPPAMDRSSRYCGSRRETKRSSAKRSCCSVAPVTGGVSGWRSGGRQRPGDGFGGMPGSNHQRRVIAGPGPQRLPQSRLVHRKTPDSDAFRRNSGNPLPKTSTKIEGGTGTYRPVPPSFVAGTGFEPATSGL